jgi:hypothetical protein
MGPQYSFGREGLLRTVRPVANLSRFMSGPQLLSLRRLKGVDPLGRMVETNGGDDRESAAIFWSARIPANYAHAHSAQSRSACLNTVRTASSCKSGG